LTEPRKLVVLRSAAAEPFRDLPGWAVSTVVLGRQEMIDVPDSVFQAALERNQALAITSPRGARWLAEREVPADLLRPVLVAGPTTGALVPNRWTRLIPSITGGAAVAGLAAERGYVLLLYAGAEETAGTLEEQAKSLGVIVEHLPVYRTVGVEDLRQQDRDALDSTRSFAFLAPSAVRYLFEADSHRFDYLSRRAVAVAYGEATREQLGKLGWKRVLTCAGPALPQIVQALEAA